MIFIICRCGRLPRRGLYAAVSLRTEKSPNRSSLAAYHLALPQSAAAAILGASLLLALCQLVPVPQHLLHLQSPAPAQLPACMGVAAFSPGWYEGDKALHGSTR